MTYHLFTDGSYNPHLHISSIGGYVLNEEKETVFEFSEKLTQESLLKYHELFALQHGLQLCIKENIKQLVCYSDDISLRNLNGLDVLERNNIEPVKKQLLEHIIELKQKFEGIEFRHIRRKFNKKADKLAERIQLAHFYDNIFFKERFEIASKKLLRIPNLFCLEDFYNKYTTEEQIENVENNLEKKLLNSHVFYILTLDTIDEHNAVANIYSLDKTTKERTFLDYRQFETKKVNSHCLDLLECTFKNVTNKPTMGFMILSENLALKKFDMLLRKRFIFPKVKTPLAERFLASCNNFSDICLIDYVPKQLTLNNCLQHNAKIKI